MLTSSDIQRLNDRLAAVTDRVCLRLPLEETEAVLRAMGATPACPLAEVVAGAGEAGQVWCAVLEDGADAGLQLELRWKTLAGSATYAMARVKRN